MSRTSVSSPSSPPRRECGPFVLFGRPKVLGEPVYSFAPAQEHCRSRLVRRIRSFIAYLCLVLTAVVLGYQFTYQQSLKAIKVLRFYIRRVPNLRPTTIRAQIASQLRIRFRQMRVLGEPSP